MKNLSFLHKKIPYASTRNLNRHFKNTIMFHKIYKYSTLEKELDESLKKYSQEKKRILLEIKEKKQLGNEIEMDEKKKERKKKEEIEKEESFSDEELDTPKSKEEGWKTWDPSKPKDKTFKYENLIKMKLGKKKIKNKKKLSNEKLIPISSPNK